jgi:NhaA family Na+:H+ antiporter
MSLFIDTLAFENLPVDTIFDFDARLGILLGSLASGVLGYLVLDRTLPRAGR